MSEDMKKEYQIKVAVCGEAVDIGEEHNGCDVCSKQANQYHTLLKNTFIQKESYESVEQLPLLD